MALLWRLLDGATAVATLVWAGLAWGRGGFWRTSERLPGPAPLGDWPPVAIIVPARNEAALLPITLPSLLSQDYPGPFRVFLVDDNSSDDTAEVAREAARRAGLAERLTVVPSRPPPPGWRGKVWAMAQGMAAARESGAPAYLLFTDADIRHPPDSLRRLVSLAEARGLDTASAMVMLRAEGTWERLLVPPFVYFFAKLYPFAWVNDPRRRTAAAAGGCLLVRREALEQMGGLEVIAGAVIDDCALARAVKERGRPGGGCLWLGLADDIHSLRLYHGLSGVWEMVARSAYAQLGYSPALLALTVAGMLLTYLAPPLAALLGLTKRRRWPLLGGLLGWGVMSFTYLPMLRWYRLPAWWAPTLPLAALLYTLMTVDSARRHWQGRGTNWRGRPV